MLADRRTIFFMVAPALLVYSAIMLVPIIWSFVYTAFSGSPVEGFQFVGLGNYAKLLADPDFWAALRFTAEYAVLVTIGQIFFGYLLALSYQFFLKRASVLVRTLVFFPVVLPTVAVAQMFMKMFSIAPQNGLVNSLLSAVGLGSAAQDWLGSSGGAFFVLILMDIWRSMGFYAVLLYAGLVDIPDELIESARIDGASGWRLIRRIVLPLMTPILVSSIIFSINGSLKVFDTVIALTNGGPGVSTTPLTLLMYNTSFTYGNYGYGSTIAVSLMILCLVATLALFGASRKDVTE
jgi:multiple sugar transport system permease protein/raffinose/stachyose/melibiose transport system permease protein